MELLAGVLALARQLVKGNIRSWIHPGKAKEDGVYQLLKVPVPLRLPLRLGASIF